MSYEDRADELAEITTLTEGEARVQALLEEDKGRQEIAEKLGIAPSTVDTNKQRIKDRVERARATLEEIDV